MPSDPASCPDTSIQVWPVDHGKILIAAASGVAFIELFVEGDDTCGTFIDYATDLGNNSIPKQVTVTESELRRRLPDKKRNKKLRLEIYSVGLASLSIPDISLLKPKRTMVKLPNGQQGYKGNVVGTSSVPGSTGEQLILESAYIQTKLLTSVKVYHGSAIEGIEFLYEDSTSQLFGRRDSAEKNEFVLGEDIFQFLFLVVDVVS
jgi:hypothetical protein